MPRASIRNHMLFELHSIWRFLQVPQKKLERAALAECPDMDLDAEGSSSAFDLVELNMLMIKAVLKTFERIMNQRYLTSRQPVRRPESIMTFLRNVASPQQFRRYARMSREVFNLLVKAIQDSEVFNHPSLEGGRPQTPVWTQVLITLIRFGHEGDMARLDHIADLARIGLGTVALFTDRVIWAITNSNLRAMHVRWPTGDEKEAAKALTAQRSGIEEWRNDFCMVDGTIIPIWQKPHYCGTMWYDRKSNYSMNVQIINTGNLKIIDYSTGFVGSRHDTSCFDSTALGQRHSELLCEDEWCWADAGYPLQSWLIIPYKKPMSEIRNNRRFNTRLSQVRIASEHAIGYLKGRFHSLKSLRVNMNKDQDVGFAMNWVNACIITHSFCQDHQDDIDMDFLHEGLQEEFDGHTSNTGEENSIRQDHAHAEGVASRAGRDRAAALQLGKAARSRLQAFIDDD